MSAARLKRDVHSEDAAWSSLAGELQKHDIAAPLQARFGARLDHLIEGLLACCDALRGAFGDHSRLSEQALAQEEQCSLDFALLPHRCLKDAQEVGCEYDVALHDDRTSLKGPRYMGCLLEVLAAGGPGVRFVMGSAVIEGLEVVEDHWSPQQRELVLLVACRCVARVAGAWNQRHSGDAHCTALRMDSGGGIALAMVLRTDDGEPCRELVQSLREAVGRELEMVCPFTELPQGACDRKSKPVVGKGPSLTIGLSEMLTSGSSGIDLTVMEGLARAEKLRDEWRVKWRTGLQPSHMEAKMRLAELRSQAEEYRTALDDVYAEVAEIMTEEGCAIEVGGVVFEDDVMTQALALANQNVAVLMDRSSNVEAKEQAVVQLGDPPSGLAGQAAFAQTAGAEGLVAALDMQYASDGLKAQIASTIMKLAATKENQLAIAAAGAIDRLIGLLRHEEHEGISYAAAGALRCLARHPDCRDEIVNGGGIKALIALLDERAASATQEQAAQCLANLASSAQDKARIVAAGALGPLVSLLDRGV